MKKIVVLLLAVLLLTVASAAYAAKLGIMTGTVSQGEEEYRAGEEMVALYGPENVTHVTYPDRFMDEQETTISQVISLAADPDIKVILICQAVPGTAAAIDKVRELRDDILFILGTPHEEPYMIAAAADVLFEIDQPTRGRTIIEGCGSKSSDFIRFGGVGGGKGGQTSLKIRQDTDYPD